MQFNININILTNYKTEFIRFLDIYSIEIAEITKRKFKITGFLINFFFK